MQNQPVFIRDVPMSERPRERLLNEGANYLSNQELLAILLRTGTKTASALQLAQKILQHFDGLYLLRDATVDELKTIKGIGVVKAVELCAALELGKRIHNLKQEEALIIRSPEDVANYVMEEMRFLTQEHFVVLYLNTKNRVLHRQTIFIGSLNVSIVHPREIVRP